jgi:hypothetical protein
MYTSRVTHTILAVALVELSVAKQNFKLTVNNSIAVKSCLNNLVWECKQGAVALRLAITPLSSVYRPSKAKLAQASAIALSILKCAFIDITVWKDQLSRPVADALIDLSIIILVRNKTKFIHGIFDKCGPVSGEFSDNKIFYCSVFAALPKLRLKVFILII